MTPSEIAERLHDLADGTSDYWEEFYTQAAATIRAQAEALEIAEGDRDVARNDCDMMVERMKRYEYELKIATEALDKIADVYVSKIANEALARIKEVG